jgi:hypothetical protein
MYLGGGKEGRQRSRNLHEDVMSILVGTRGGLAARAGKIVGIRCPEFSLRIMRGNA